MLRSTMCAPPQSRRIMTLRQRGGVLPNRNKVLSPSRKGTTSSSRNGEILQEEIYMPSQRSEEQSVAANINLDHGEHRVLQEGAIEISKVGMSSSSPPDESHQMNSKDAKDKKQLSEELICKACRRCFKSERGLQNHVNVKHKELSDTFFKNAAGNSTSLVCNICGKSFSCLGNLNTHKRRHTGVKTHKCPKCDKRFYTDHERKSHMMLHADLLPLMCEVCGLGVRTRTKLLIHMRRHTGDRPSKCDICGKCFYTNHDRNVHRKTHTTDRSFACGTCGSTYRTHRALRVHETSHVVERSHKCSLCDKSFILAHGLDSHMRQVHTIGASHGIRFHDK